MYKGYLIDLDGTMYRGNERIDGAKEFIDGIHDAGYPYLFVTNNSSATQEEIAAKLTGMGIHARKEQIVTTALATANYIKRQKEQARVYMIGESGLKQALMESGAILADQAVDFVVSGIDRDISYEKLSKACVLIRDGAVFLSTNKDAAIPTERGLLPGNGALTSVLTVSTGVEPVFVGKPEAIIMEEALALIGLGREDVLMVGDNYETDISAGIHAQIDTLMVLTGFSTKEDIAKQSKQPTYLRHDLKGWMQNRQAAVF